MNYRAEIDGLRALAVLPVIFFHAGFENFGGGFVGVDVFFVISGYLITTIIISEMAENKFSIVNFYERRSRRILPPLFLVMLASLPFAWLWLTPGDLKDFGQSLVAVSTFSSNILFWWESGYFDTTAELKPLLHTWSLAVEEQFYILFPLFLLLTWGLGVRRLVVLLFIIFPISLIAAHWGAFNQPNATFYWLPTRIWELLVGVFAAFYLKYNSHFESLMINQVLSLLGLAMIIFSILVFDANTPFPSFYALIPTVGTGLLILSAVKNTFVHKVLSYSPLVGVGLISYSAYLWHQPILSFARHRSLGELSDILLIFLCFASLLVAYVSWKWVEKPFRDKNKVSRKLIFSWSIFGLLSFFLFGLTIHKNNGFDERFSIALSKLEDLRLNSINSTKACEVTLSSGTLDDVLSKCLIGDLSQKPTFVVIGDSHARALIPAFDEYGNKSGTSGLNFSHASCLPTLGNGTYLPFDNEQRKCLALRARINGLLEKNWLPERVIIAARWTMTYEKSRYDNMEGGIEPGGEIKYINSHMPDFSYRESVRMELASTFEKYSEHDYDVTIIYQIPEVGWNPVRRMMKEEIIKGPAVLPDTFASTDYEAFLVRNSRTISLLDNFVSEYGMTKFDPHLLYCNLEIATGRCIAILNNNPLYYDEDHPSLYGGRLIVDKIALKK